MNLGDNLTDSFNYTKKLLADAGRLIILIILDIVPIVNWIVIGYAARILKESPSHDAPPKLENYGELFVGGAKVFFASFIYLIIPIGLIVAGGSSIFVALFSGEAPRLLLGGTGLGLVSVGIILAVAALIILNVGIAHMIKTGQFGKAFAFGEIFIIMRGIGCGKYLSWVVLVTITTAIVSGIAGSIPVVGWLVSAIIAPALIIFIFRSMGLLYNDGAPSELRVEAISPRLTLLVCVACGTQLQPYHKFCPNCGSPAPPPPIQATLSTSEAKTKFCISCGSRIPSTAGFCGSCGAKQN
jgi:ribosomal protein L40E